MLSIKLIQLLNIICGLSLDQGVIVLELVNCDHLLGGNNVISSGSGLGFRRDIAGFFQITQIFLEFVDGFGCFFRLDLGLGATGVVAVEECALCFENCFWLGLGFGVWRGMRLCLGFEG